ncbi:MAG: anti-sigma factor [Planctomycetaceae bacterium]|nr:anti-sigma factor [Planctomycetaceae bacterium]
MKFLLATLPDDTASQARWLEEHLLGLDLAGVVTELKAMGTGREEPMGLDAALGDVLPQILRGGLGHLTTSHIQTLLRNPQILLELQTRIFLEGGDYWNNLPEPTAEIQDAVDRGRSRLHQFVTSQGGSAPSTTSNPSKTEPSRFIERTADRQSERAPATSPPPRAGRRWFSHPLVVSLATAAAVLAGVFVAQPDRLRPGQPGPSQVAQGWGWSKPGAIDESLEAKTYLAKLSAGADDWFKKRPATPQALAQRILEFRQGCSTLILSEHRPLLSEDKAWLIERCQAWAKKLDGHVADVEAGKDILQVRQEADETVNKLKKALLERSEKV